MIHAPTSNLERMKTTTTALTTALPSGVAEALCKCLLGLLLAGGQVLAPAVAQDPAPATPSALDISLELERRQSALQFMEEALGVYEPALVEAYSDLARFYTDHGYAEEAAALYRQALMVVRVNAGLNSEQQLPVLDALITSSGAASHWQDVDDGRELKFYLQRKLYGPADPRYLAAVTEYGDWKLRLIRENLLEQNYRTLSREAESLSHFYDSALTGIDAAGQGTTPALTPLLYGKSVTDLELARYLAETPYQYFQGTVSQYISQTICNNVRAPDGSVQRSCYTVQRENPRYRQSQQDVKRMEVLRSMRQVDSTIDRLQAILQANPDLPAAEQEQLQRRIGELRVEYERIDRVSRRGMLL